MRKLVLIIAFFTFAETYSQIIVGKFMLTSFYIAKEGTWPIYFDVISSDSICNQINGDTKDTFIQNVLSKSFYTADANIENLCDLFFEKKDIDTLLYESKDDHMGRLVDIELDMSYNQIKKNEATEKMKSLKDCKVYYKMYNIYGVFYKTYSNKELLASNSNGIDIADYPSQECMVPIMIYFSTPIICR